MSAFFLFLSMYQILKILSKKKSVIRSCTHGIDIPFSATNRSIPSNYTGNTDCTIHMNQLCCERVRSCPTQSWQRVLEWEMVSTKGTSVRVCFISGHAKSIMHMDPRPLLLACPLIFWDVHYWRCNHAVRIKSCVCRTMNKDTQRNGGWPSILWDAIPPNPRVIAPPDTFVKLDTIAKL